MLQILEFTEAHLSTVTARSQKHGDDEVPAVSIGLELTVANTLLDEIDPTIRTALYKRVDGQDDLPGVETTTPVLRCNSIDRTALATKYEGWTLEVDDGIDDTKPLLFGGCKVDKFSVEPKQGGSCLLRMRAGTSDLDAERSGFLGMHVGQSIWIKLRAPEKVVDSRDEGDQATEPDASDMFAATAEDQGGEDEHGNPFPFEADPQTPEAAFIATAAVSDAKVTVKRGKLSAVGK